MRHQKRVKKLGVNQDHRRALIKNLCNELFEHKRIVTTVAKAKAARMHAERLLSFAKKGDLSARRILISRLGKRRLTHGGAEGKKYYSVIQELVEQIGPKLKVMDEERKSKNPNYTGGGYTRVMRLGQRKGDGAELAVLEIVGYEKDILSQQSAAIEEKETREKRRMTLAERIKAKKDEMQSKS